MSKATRPKPKKRKYRAWALRNPTGSYVGSPQLFCTKRDAKAFMMAPEVPVRVTITVEEP